MIPGYRYLVRVSPLHADVEASETVGPAVYEECEFATWQEVYRPRETSYWTWGAHGGDVAVSHWVSINSAEHVRTKRYDTDSNAPVDFCYPVLFFFVHVISTRHKPIWEHINQQNKRLFKFKGSG